MSRGARIMAKGVPPASPPGRSPIPPLDDRASGACGRATSGLTRPLSYMREHALLRPPGGAVRASVERR